MRRSKLARAFVVGDLRRSSARPVVAALISFGLAALTVSSDDMFVRRSSNDLHVLAPRLHFLTPKTLQRLRDGAIAPFDFQLTISAGSKNNVIARAVERFVVSYDLWQEKFSVVRMRDYRKWGMNASASAAEAWCVDNMVIEVSQLASQVSAGQQLWARLEIRSVDQKNQPPPVSDSGISIISLVELFSRPPHPQQDHWMLETAAFHLDDLKP
ncbi:MAG TPA: hypothetical protein VMH05_22210 [Bryobacteraceae bacterium]|nr:hypothetical protein [Bryobacteraceae bacterium]